MVPLSDSTELFEIGYGATLAGRYQFGSSPLHGVGGFSFSSLATKASSSVNILDLGVGPALILQPGEADAVDLEIGTRIGGYLSLYEGESGSNPFGTGYGAIRFRVSESFRIGTGAGYSYYPAAIPDPNEVLFQGIQGFLTIRWSPGTSRREQRPEIRIEPPSFDRIFPVFYRYYDENEIGQVEVVNEERGDIRDVEVSVFVPQYMDAPQVVATFEEIPRDERVTVPLKALFAERILGITENTSVQARIAVRYTRNDITLEAERADTLRIQNRNQMTWDDDRKAAAFVTAGDPTVLRLSRNVTAVTRRMLNVAVNERLRSAMAIHETLGLYGIEYVIDPDSSYIELSQNESALDYLQFPVQTLDYRAGDCDDLSILYCALFESVGIPTAFVTVPGHIFMAFDLGVSEQEARRTFADPDQLIFHNGTAWIPVETTIVGQDFLQAWSTGASQYREHGRRDAVGFYPVRDAWSIYEPTGFASEALAVSFPNDEAIGGRYETVLTRFIEREIAPQVQDLEQRIAQRPSPRLYNRLGTLYARYGLYDRAIETFRRALSEEPYAPSLYNMANIFFVRGNVTEALSYYRQAVTLRPDDPEGLIGLARAHFELGRYDEAASHFEEARIIDPEVAEPFAYIVSESVSTGRASAAAERNRVIWEDE